MPSAPPDSIRLPSPAHQACSLGSQQPPPLTQDTEQGQSGAGLLLTLLSDGKREAQRQLRLSDHLHLRAQPSDKCSASSCVPLLNRHPLSTAALGVPRAWAQDSTYKKRRRDPEVANSLLSTEASAPRPEPAAPGGARAELLQELTQSEGSVGSSELHADMDLHRPDSYQGGAGPHFNEHVLHKPLIEVDI
ncbi:hypothetical protein TREES_T100007285 [Tupaia chinensis]|uniref:Uncharacterized protein n=1 Tax=Tupaia chinensis TaxID=246437 RepID=L9L0Q7_TUPCH|nr:hypothetical protein TREES_T100007285 [Tupaia chinensis]